jgi:hypothetical protein
MNEVIKKCLTCPCGAMLHWVRGAWQCTEPTHKERLQAK